MNNLMSLSSAQLKHAADLKEKITTLEKELSALLGDSAPVTSAPKKSKMSTAARARIAAAQKARWAKVKKAEAAPVVASKPKRTMSPAGRAKIVAAQKARWAKIKAAKKTA